MAEPMPPNPAAQQAEIQRLRGISGLTEIGNTGIFTAGKWVITAGPDGQSDTFHYDRTPDGTEIVAARISPENDGRDGSRPTLQTVSRDTWNDELSAKEQSPNGGFPIPLTDTLFGLANASTPKERLEGFTQSENGFHTAKIEGTTIAYLVTDGGIAPLENVLTTPQASTLREMNDGQGFQVTGVDIRHNPMPLPGQPSEVTLLQLEGAGQRFSIFQPEGSPLDVSRTRERPIGDVRVALTQGILPDTGAVLAAGSIDGEHIADVESRLRATGYLGTGESLNRRRAINNEVARGSRASHEDVATLMETVQRYGEAEIEAGRARRGEPISFRLNGRDSEVTISEPGGFRSSPVSDFDFRQGYTVTFRDVDSNATATWRGDSGVEVLRRYGMYDRPNQNDGRSYSQQSELINAFPDTRARSLDQLPHIYEKAVSDVDRGTFGPVATNSPAGTPSWPEAQPPAQERTELNPRRMFDRQQPDGIRNSISWGDEHPAEMNEHLGVPPGVKYKDLTPEQQGHYVEGASRLAIALHGNTSAGLDEYTEGAVREVAAAFRQAGGQSVQPKTPGLGPSSPDRGGLV